MKKECVTYPIVKKINSFCHQLSMLILFVNSLHPDQAPQNAGPDMDPNCVTP